MPILEVKNLYKNFGSTKVLKDISFSLERGKALAIIGSSGSGKTTLLRCLNFLETPNEGQIIVNGEPLFDAADHAAKSDAEIRRSRLHFGMVFQSFNLFPQYTALENVMLAPLLLAKEQPDYKKNKREIHEQIEHRAIDLLTRMSLEGRMSHYPHQLSGGQQQRVAIGRAIVREPKVLLMDEPLSNLDAKLRNQMRAELLQLRQRIDTTFIYVTHDQTEAMTLGDRIVIMKDGLIQQIGTPQEVFNHPANLFVAGFIGMPQMNFYNAELVQEDGRYAVVLDRAKVFLSDEKQTKLKKNGVRPGSVTLGVRPEHLLLTGDPNAMVCGTVNVSEMMGSAVHLHISACGTDTIIIVPTAELENANNYAIGSEVSFTFSGAPAPLFDRETGLNLEA